MKAKKEIQAAGFCVLRPDILKKNLSVQVGSTTFGGKEAILYRWLKEDEGFMVFAHGRWREAESIDFDFLSDEKEIVQRFFLNYNYTDAMEEIKEWSAKDLKQFLRVLGYKTYTKDIMITMVQDLARIHAWKLTATKQNPFLVK